MKKLIITLAVVAMAVVGNAAAITWGSGTIYLADSTKAGKDAVTAYLFTIDSATYSTLAANTTGTALSDAVYAAFGSKTASASATVTTSAKGPTQTLRTPPLMRMEIPYMRRCYSSKEISIWGM